VSEIIRAYYVNQM